ncbi:MAG: hypothetical protein P8Z69_07455 [Acidihalobacter sp.]
MTWKNILTVWSDSLWVSAVVWALLAIVLLYLARRPAHEALRVASSALARWLRAAARALSGVRGRLLNQQRILHAAMALDMAERRIERTTRRFAHSIERDLGAFPQLQRRLTDQIERIDRDYHDSADTPPVPPQWLDAVDAVARTQGAGDSAVAGILDAMHGTLTRAAHDSLDEFRFVSRKRHGLLRRMLPQWRRAARMLSRMDGNVAVLTRRAESIDGQIERYTQLRDEPPALTLGAQAQYWMRCVFAAAALVVMGVLAVTEHALLAPPLLALLPNPASVFGVPLAHVEAWVVIGAEVVFGLLLLEVNRATRLLPALGLLGPRARLRSGVLLGLLWLATVAFAGTMVVLGAPTKATVAHSIAEVGVVVLLALLLLPTGLLLDMVLNTGRSVVLSVLGGILEAAALLLRVLGWLARLAGRVLIYAYDLVVFLPLAIDAVIAMRRRHKAAEEESDPEAPAAPSS